MPKSTTNYESRFETALRRIAAYDSTSRLRRQSEHVWGVGFEEAIEMAYENIQEEARAALRGYRRPRKIAVAATPESGRNT